MKNILLTLCISTLALITHAQGVEFGFQVSPTITWMSNSDRFISSSGTSLGVRVGMIGDFYFTENYAFSTGVGFSFNQGGRLLYSQPGRYWPQTDKTPEFQPDDVLPAGTKLRYNIQLLEFPVGFKMRTREFGYLRYYLQPNVLFGFRTQAKGRIEGPGIPSTLDKLDIRKEVNVFNFSIGIGGGIEYTVAESIALIGGFNLLFGVTDMTQDQDNVIEQEGGVFSEEDSKATINGFILSFGVLF